MRFLKSLTVGSLLFISTAYANGFGLYVGPFDLQFNGGETYYVDNHREMVDNPICYAISHQKRLEMLVESSEKTNAKEIKIAVKKLVVEPYAFLVTKDGKPALRGNIISEKMVKEIAIKYGEDKFDHDDEEVSWQKKKGYFSGWFKSDKSQTVDIRRVSRLQVIEDSHFDAPKNYKEIKEDGVQIICQLSAAEE